MADGDVTFKPTKVVPPWEEPGFRFTIGWPPGFQAAPLERTTAPQRAGGKKKRAIDYAAGDTGTIKGGPLSKRTRKEEVPA